MEPIPHHGELPVDPMEPGQRTHAVRGSWASHPERGTRFALRGLAWFFRRVGTRPLRLLLAPIACYYCLFAGEARRASRAYLRRVDRAGGGAGRRPGLREVYRHVYTFADVILDRFSFWTGSYDHFEIVFHGREDVEHHFADGGGAFLIGAHLGSFDVLRVIAREADIPVNVLLFGANAKRINETFEALDPGSNVRVIDLDPTSIRAAFEMRRCAQRGELIAVLGDRLSSVSRSRVASASFLGETASFPTGPFLLAMVMRLPVVLTLALKTGPRRYDIFLETLAERQVVPVREREKAAREQVESFAARLEHYCLQAPLQWFNFYDFWQDPRK